MKTTFITYHVLLVPFQGIGHLMEPLCKKLNELDINATVKNSDRHAGDAIQINFRDFIGRSSILTTELLEHVIQQLPIQFDNLPLLVEGESKIVKQLNAKMVVEQFKPTVYSFTHNRYGEAEGTAELRILFTAELFRRMNKYNEQYVKKLNHAFLAELNTSDGPLLVQRKIETCNLEVRVKRYHIGSPLHRYKYTEKYPTVQPLEEPLKKWSKFDVPVVCFDWRHPLTDEAGNRLADEPISDDYAAVWMCDVAEGKKLARETFSWMERLFQEAGLLLVDVCFFIDKTGTMLYGEISPDCMRVKKQSADPGLSDSFDKDLWREGEKEQLVSKRYQKLFHMLFSQTTKI